MGPVVVIVTLLTLAISGGADVDNGKCSKEWIRYLILNACNFSKRDAEMMEYIMEESITTNRDLFSKYMSHQVEAQASIIRRRLQPITTKPIVKQPLTLEDFDVSTLHQHMTSGNSLWQRRARSIRQLMERCCSTLCDEKDFRVLCYVGMN